MSIVCGLFAPALLFAGSRVVVHLGLQVDWDLDMVQVRLRRKVGTDRLRRFAAFQMLFGKIGAKICRSFQLASRVSVEKNRQ